VADLAERSLEVLAAGQSASGAYVASPTFEQYRYCWFRDGSFIAEAMSRWGRRESAERFFDWCAAIVRGNPRGPWDARYRLDGGRDPVGWWPHRQLDGHGLWLWALRRHLERHGCESRWDDAVAATTAYLREHWADPCIDWWEEREGVHAATLASVWAGIGGDVIAKASAAAVAVERPDGSHAFLVVLGLGDAGLLDAVEEQLGYHRHRDDEYYGGGEWPVLAGLVGWARARLGRDSEPQLRWLEEHAERSGWLPEQTGEQLHPASFDVWLRRSGPPASPLLWSHAMYLILRDAGSSS
jgi:GH15 family glucan-1,4-alpha-glucosidase